jgi:glucan endo-1,3-alpha-glucosidase
MTVYKKGSSTSTSSNSVSSAITGAQGAESTPAQTHSAVTPVPTPPPPTSSSSSDKTVAAHFIVGNSFVSSTPFPSVDLNSRVLQSYNKDTWLSDIKLAHSKGIDAFALNLGSDWWEKDRVSDAVSTAHFLYGRFSDFLLV